MTWFGTIWPTCRRRHLTLSNRFAIKCGECTARRKYESCSQRAARSKHQANVCLGSYALEPSRGAGRLCPEFYKSEYLRAIAAGLEASLRRAEASGPPSRWLDCWRRPAGALSAQTPPPHEWQPAALSGAFCGLSIESTTIVRRVIGFERFRARARGPALIARQPSRRTVANRHESSGRSTMSFDARQRDAAPDDATWLAELNARATLTQQRLAELKVMLDEMRMERDAWRDQALRLALPAPAPSITLWRWLRSTG